MNALTTRLAERAMAKAKTPPDGLKLYRDAAQAQVQEPVIDACLFSRPSRYAAGKLARQSSLLTRMAWNKRQAVRAGGLPQHFVLAVTPGEVIALERTLKAGGSPIGEGGEEVARWRRADLSVTWKSSGYLFDVTIQSPGESEKVECCVGKSDLGESFLGLLADPQATEPAAA
jgi:hypothetical protein